MKKYGNRIEYISLASVLSAIAVVFLHSNEWANHFSTSPEWFSANLIHAVFIFAVPIFFMISGAMLLDFNKKYDLKTYFTKRINKAVIPYILWSLFGLIFQIYYLNTINVTDVNLTYILTGLATGKLVSIYWFFISLFLLYISLTIVSRFIDTKQKCFYALIITFMINFFLTLHDHHPMVGYLFYSLFGYYVHKYGVNEKTRKIFYILSAIGFLIILFGTYFLSLNEGKIVIIFRLYNNLPILFYSTGLFILLKYNYHKFMDNEIINKIVSSIEYYTLGIYLVHWYILQVLVKTLNIDITSLIYRFFSPFIVIPLCVLIIYILRKIPLVKRSVP